MQPNTHHYVLYFHNIGSYKAKQKKKQKTKTQKINSGLKLEVQSNQTSCK